MAELFKKDMIVEFCKCKKVLHIGACDSPYHIDKTKKGTLLHQKLQKVCEEIIGIDIDKKTIVELKNLGIDDIFYGDIIRDEYEIDLQKFSFDYIIFGDVIEHLENPGSALDNIKKLMNENTKLILTTPNCFSYAAMKIIRNYSPLGSPHPTTPRSSRRIELRPDHFDKSLSFLLRRFIGAQNHFEHFSAGPRPPATANLAMEYPLADSSFCVVVVPWHALVIQERE